MVFKLVFALSLIASATCDVSHLFRKPSNNLVGPARNFVSVYREQPVFRPQSRRPQPVNNNQRNSLDNVEILRQDSDLNPDGSYQWSYETQNGISAQERASIRQVAPEESLTNAQGSFQFTSPEGKTFQISYVADENGFQPVGDHLPTPPPIPIAIQRAIDFIQGRSSSGSKYYKQ